MKKVWQGWLNTDSFTECGILPATSYILPASRRSIYVKERTAYNLDPKTYFVAFPHLLCTCIGPPYTTLLINAVPTTHFDPTTVCTPIPLPNTFPHGQICLGNEVQMDIDELSHEQLIASYFTTSFYGDFTGRFTWGLADPKCVYSFSAWEAETEKNPNLGSILRVATAYPSFRLSNLLVAKPPIVPGSSVITDDGKFGIVGWCAQKVCRVNDYGLFSGKKMGREYPYSALEEVFQLGADGERVARAIKEDGTQR